MGPSGFKASGISCSVTVTPFPSPRERHPLGGNCVSWCWGKAPWAWARECVVGTEILRLGWLEEPELRLLGGRSTALPVPRGSLWLLGEYRNAPVAQGGMFTWVNTSPVGTGVSCMPIQERLCCAVGIRKAGAAPHGWDRFFLFFPKICFYFLLLFGCFVLWTLQCFMRAVFDLPGGVCLCAAEADILPKGRENLGFA